MLTLPISIDWWIGELRRHGASEVDQYEAKLRSFRGNDQKIFELIAEARAALLFLKNGLDVTMQDRPDLRLGLNGETIYAEVKHYNEKATDRRDAAAMTAAPFEFIQVGSVIDDEGKHGWQQMCSTAIKKEPQYASGFPNILVFVNHSDALDLHLRSAVNEFDDNVLKAGAASPLRKLGGMMILKTHQSVGWHAANVEFCYTSYALHPPNRYFVQVMRLGQLA